MKHFLIAISVLLGIFIVPAFAAHPLITDVTGT